MTFQFESIASFMVMNGHGPYVWAAYAVTAAVLVYLTLSPVLQRRQFIRQQLKLGRIANKSNR